MADIQWVEDIKESLTFNLFVSTEDGRLAWTVNPLSLGDLYSDRLSSGLSSSASDHEGSRPSSLPLPLPADDELEKESVDAQSRPCDLHLFEVDEASLQVSSNNTPAQKQDYSTVRIYGHCLNFSDLATKGPDCVRPSVIAVERASLCQIFMETKYQRTFEHPNEREQRRHILESLVCKGKELTTEQKLKFNEILKSVESEWSRMSRVRPSLAAFEVLRKLGSGGFGVVNLVQEKETGNLYAMKVSIYKFAEESISKDKTLRLGHEGRVLCERDLLKKSTESGTRWICNLHYAFQDAEALYTDLRGLS
jgi:hypothetical protein